MLNIKNNYKAGKEIVKTYNTISFSISTDRIFEKIDSLATIFNVWKSEEDIVYRTKKESSDGVIKHNKWDNTITIMDSNNRYAKKVYLVSEFLALDTLYPWILDEEIK